MDRLDKARKNLLQVLTKVLSSPGVPSQDAETIVDAVERYANARADDLLDEIHERGSYDPNW